MTRDILKEGTPFYCDFYHLTMAAAWFNDNKHNEHKVSEAFIRKNPFNGGYLLTAGLGEFLEWVDNWHITDEKVEKLRGLKNSAGGPKFKEDFLEFIRGKKLEVDIKAAPEGELLFPNEPAYSISGPCWQVDMVEAALLNVFNSQSLIATKAARIVQAARSDGVQRPVLEFGLRRSQELGGFTPTRAAFIGGCSGTSNAEAGLYYDIPLAGTMAHSFIMSYEDECDAYKAFLRAFPEDGIVLPDTYETRQGIRNAVRAQKESGIEMKGLRIDSGDLAYWYKESRRMLNEGGMPDCNLIASNDLDEYLIENMLMVQGAKYDTFAAGTKLVTAYDQPALGGVFKTKRYLDKDKIKIAEGKTTVPGATDVVRIIRNGKFEGDIITRQGDALIERGMLKQKILSFGVNNPEVNCVAFGRGTEAYTVLKDVVKNGRVICEDINYSLRQIQKNAAENLGRLDETYKRLHNPHKYGVGLELNVRNNQRDMVMLYQAKQMAATGRY